MQSGLQATLSASLSRIPFKTSPNPTNCPKAARTVTHFRFPSAADVSIDLCHRTSEPMIGYNVAGCEMQACMIPQQLEFGCLLEHEEEIPEFEIRGRDYYRCSLAVACSRLIRNALGLDHVN